LLTLLVASAGCQAPVEYLGVALFYEPAELPDSQTLLDLAYRDDSYADPNKHRLDLFLPDPSSSGWPTLIFIHGGSWTSGDRTTEAGGVQLFRNIGRYFASQGVATAVISYRLQPQASWHDQLEDVADATRFVRDRVVEYGGEPDAIYLAGHSAGAWLAARVGYDAELLLDAGVPPESLCGFVLVSGAGYDMRDEETYALGASRDFFVKHFDDGAPDWETRASVVPLVRASLPRTLVLYGGADPARIQRQSEVLIQAFEQAGARIERLVVPWEGHQSIVLTLSRSDKTSAPGILDWMDATPCPGRRSIPPDAPDEP
jgi:acetyl esterase/lipase